MTFLDHLEELRWHLVRSVAAILIFSIVAFLLKEFVWGTLVLGPTRGDFWTYRMMCKFGELIGSDLICFGDLPIDMQNREMTGQFMMHITSSLVIGIIMAFPYTFWELWRFVSPGLHKKEKGSFKGSRSCRFIFVYEWCVIWLLCCNASFIPVFVYLRSGR